ncbi:MAG: DUF5615 family PIN-like protein [Chloroflexi bacterium]|nr:DUF5615 family PIN-like protein [Chloroflexota bacterium]
MRYYLDEDISPVVAALLRAQGIDALNVHEAGARGFSDKEQLQQAAQEGRCMVTRNRDDFIRLTLQWFTDQRPHFGLLIVPYSIPPDRFSALAGVLVAYAEEHPEGLSPYTVDFV